MIKSFIRLMLLVVTPLLLMLFIQGSYNPITIASNYFDEKYLLKLFDGPMRLVEMQLVTVKPPMQRIRFEQIASAFGTQLELLKESELKLSSHEKRRLSGSHTKLLFKEPVRLARRIQGTDYLIILTVNEVESQQAYRQAKGPFYLLGQYLQDYPVTHWQEVVERLNGDSAVGLSLINNKRIKHSGIITNSFSEGALSWYEYDSKNEAFFYQLSDNKRSLKLGPIPSEKRVLRSRYILSALMVLIALASVLFFWLWPLWLNIKKLKNGAISFGKGKLEGRVAIDRSSIIAELGDSFNYMADEIQKLMTVNNNLANSVAHDLRTPMARIRFAQEILDTTDCSAEEEAMYKQSIEFSINSIEHTISQTLAHSRYNYLVDIRSFTDCLFVNVFKEEVEQTEIVHPNLEFEIYICNSLKTSRQFVMKAGLRRALVNLLTNAVKHAQSKIKVSFCTIDDHVGDKIENRLAIIVEDDGEGVPEAQRLEILEPFVQRNHGHESHDLGQGLGLAIVNQVASWHKGDLVVGESPLGGAMFRLSWPPLINPNQGDDDEKLSVQLIS